MLRVGALAPVALLLLARAVLWMPEGAAVWAQALSVLSIGGALWGALAAAGARDLRSLAVGALIAQASLSTAGLWAFKLDAWSGAILAALTAGLAGAVWVALAPTGDITARQGALSRPRAAALALAGLSMAGAPLTAGGSALLLLVLGCWQSVWWQGSWWAGGLLLASWLLGWTCLRTATALSGGTDPLPRPALPALLLLLLLGLVPRTLLDLIDRTSVERLSALLPALEQLMSGALSETLPAWMRGWWF